MRWICSVFDFIALSIGTETYEGRVQYVVHIIGTWSIAVGLISCDIRRRRDACLI